MDCRFQRHIEYCSDLLVRFVYKPLQWWDLSLKFGSYIPTVPLHWLADGLFDWDVNLNPLRKYYENGIERTYGFVPLAKIANSSDEDFLDINYANHVDLPFFPRAYAKDVFFSDLGNYDCNNNLKNRCFNNPFWIVNTTTGRSDKWYANHGMSWIINNDKYSSELFD